MTNPSEEPRQPLTPTQWLIIVIAIIGFAFDTYELLMMPLIGGDALAELLHVSKGDPLVREWIGYILWSSAFVGGSFGLLGGWLTDRLGRRRVLTWSILLYAVSACLAAFSTSAPMFLVLRCTTFMGVCVEFVAAIAWLAELFPEPRRRETVLGYTQAFSSVGGLLVTGVSHLVANHSFDLPAIYGGHSTWRYILISGVFPAIPLILIRPFLPESPVWAAKRAAGTLKRASLGELFQPALRRTTLLATLLNACCFAAAFGALQLTPTQIVPGLPTVLPLTEQQQAANKKLAAANKQLADKASAKASVEELNVQKKEALAELKKLAPQTGAPRDAVQFFQEIGGLVGRFLLAWLALRIVGRGNLLRVFIIPGLFLFPWLYLYPAQTNLDVLKAGIFVAGLVTVAQFSYWGNYLPRVFPVHLRGTGEGFAVNVGGRMIGASGAFVTTQLAKLMPGANSYAQLAYAAALTGFVVYAVALVASFFLPEPPREDLPE